MRIMSGAKRLKYKSPRLFREYVVHFKEGSYYRVLATNPESAVNTVRIVMEIGENKSPNTPRPSLPGQSPKTPAILKRKAETPLCKDSVQVYATMNTRRLHYPWVSTRLSVQIISEQEALALIQKKHTQVR